ncbi:hypothetical protein FDP51_12220 [Enterococcus mundtii]|uniref:Uncharacterized protein n=1 Tax=Enterococcus mundtii TaxID=53346 RepID=A0A2S7RZV3_ENTMU|nr:hypothetical protein [Enterococcus mundtii]PQF25812.1 hypothetical protein CUS89_00420 [Enterococcus mundtii]
MNGYKIGLIVSMILSILCLLGILIDYRGYVGFILSFVIIIPGFLGIYFTTKTTMKKYLEWTLLVVNYLFATTLSGWYFIHAILHLYK